MTPRSFWTILIKIIGIWFVLDSVMIVYQFITYLFVLNKSDSLMMLVSTLGILLLTMGFYALVLYLCIFNTGWVIDKFKLDKGFLEDKFEINLHRSTVLSIAIIVVGGVLFIDSFPQFCRQLIVYFYQSNVSIGYNENPTWSFVILHFIKTFIGYYFMTNSKLIVNFIERKRRVSRPIDKERNEIE